MSAVEGPIQDSASTMFERDLRRVLRARAADSAPIALRASIPMAVTERVGLGRRIRIGFRSPGVEDRRRRASFVATGLALVVVAVAAAVGLSVKPAPSISSGHSVAPGVVASSPSGTRKPIDSRPSISPAIPAAGPTAPRKPNSGRQPSANQAVSWHTGPFTLEADSVSITAGDQTFAAPKKVSYEDSDAGDVTSRTLDVRWMSDGHLMRLYFDLRANAEKWWISEIRTYDGQPAADWIHYPVHILKTPIGQAYHDDLDIRSEDGSVPGHLVITGLTLSAFQPHDGAKTEQDCRPVQRPSSAYEHEPADAGEPLAGAGLLSMSTKEAAAFLRARNYCYSFRVMMRDPNGPKSAGFGQMWCATPPGMVGELAYGSLGQLIIFVKGTVYRSLQPRPPVRVGC